MARLQIFIAPQSTDNNFIEIDLFEDEAITMVDTIQNVKDISKVYNPFSKGFSVPSSAVNDSVFGHYYDNHLREFDASRKCRAMIKIDGIDYKEGYVMVTDVAMNTLSNPTSYSISFSENMSSIKTKLSSETLRDLDYNTINIPDTSDTILKGIRDGLFISGSTDTDEDGNDLYPDIIYAPVFTKGKAVPVPFMTGSTSPSDGTYDFFLSYFDKDTTDGINKAHEGYTGYYPNPVYLEDYRPAFKVGRLLKMINESHKLGFNNSFMEREELDQMYLWFNGKSEVSQDSTNVKIFSNGSHVEKAVNYTINYASNSNDAEALHPGLDFTEFININPVSMSAYDANTNNYQPGAALSKTKFELDVDKGAFTSKIGATVEFFFIDEDDIPRTLWTATNSDIRNGYNKFQATEINEKNKQKLLLHTEGDKMQFRVTLSTTSAIRENHGVKILFRQQIPTSSQLNNLSLPATFYSTQSQTISDIETGAGYVPNVNYKNLAPNMKLVDFITGLIKMLNLTMYDIAQGETLVQTVEQFYNSNSRVIDIGKYADARNFKINRTNVITDTKFKFNKSDDVLSNNYRSTIGDINFGDKHRRIEDNETYAPNAASQSDSKDITVPFSCIQYERLYLGFGEPVLNDNGTENDDSDDFFDAPVLNRDFEFNDRNAITDMMVGHSINSKLEKVELKNLLFFAKKVDTTRAFFDSATNSPTVIQDLAGFTDEDGNKEYGNTAGMVGASVNGRRYVIPAKTAVDEKNDNLDTGKNDDADKGFGSRMKVFTPEDGGNEYNGDTDSHKWWIPSNIMASRYRRNGEYVCSNSKFQSLTFNDNALSSDEYEFYDVQYTGSANGYSPLESSLWKSGLYNSFYENYLDEIYHPTSRMYNMKCNFDSSFIADYNLNDKFLIGEKQYKINSASINLSTGDASMQLITNEIETFRGAIINDSSLVFVSALSGSLVMKLESVTINDVYPDKLEIYNSGVLVDTITGLTESDFTQVGENLYSLDITSTYTVPANVDNLIRVKLVSTGIGESSSLSNTVNAFRWTETTAPTVTISTPTLSNNDYTIDFDVTATDTESGVVNLEVVFNRGSVFPTYFTVMNGPFFGGTKHFSRTVSRRPHIIEARATDAAGNTSGWTSVSVDTSTGDDLIRPNTPNLVSVRSNIKRNNLSLTNISDNIGVTKVEFVERPGANETVISTQFPTGTYFDGQTVNYQHLGYNREFRYGAYCYDAAGNRSYLSYTTYYDENGNLTDFSAPDSEDDGGFVQGF